MRWVSAKFIPKLLSDEQKQHRLQVDQEMINRSENDPDLLNRVIAGDESWVYGYDPETNAQSSQWKSPGSPRPKKRDKVGRMWRWWWWSFSILGVSCIMDMPLGDRQSTRNTIKVSLSVYAKFWGRKSLHSGEILHHDNAPAHHAFSIIEFLAKFQIPVLPQPPYSPDIAPADFYQFQKLKFSQKGHRFDSIEDIQANTERDLNTLKKENFQECFQKWKHRWSRCVQSQGDNFEGDPSQ